MNNLSEMKVRTPNCSAFPVRWTTKLASKIGETKIVNWLEMGPNDRWKLSVSQLSRMLTLKAPTMANYRLDVDAVFVPTRIASKRYEKYFNPGTPDNERPYFLYIPYGTYIDMLLNQPNLGLYTPKLCDDFGFPTFPEIARILRNCYNSLSVYQSSYSFDSLDDDLDSILDNLSFSSDGNVCNESAFSGGFGFVFSSLYKLLTPYQWLVMGGRPNNWRVTMPADQTAFNARQLAFKGRYGYFASANAYIEKICKLENLHSVDFVDAYLNFFAYCVYHAQYDGFLELDSLNGFTGLLFDTGKADTLPTAADVSDFINETFSLAPVICFWKFYFDWAVNSVLENGEELTDNFTDCVTSWIDNGSDIDEFTFESYPLLESFFGVAVGGSVLFSTIPTRLWALDRFTSAFTDLQNGPAIRVPVDGTIRDLKASNILQRFNEKRLFGGTRTIDKNEQIYGAKSSNKLLDRTEVLCRRSFTIDVQQVTSTSSTDNAMLGELAGQGFGFGGEFLFDYTCEERGFIIVMASVVLPPSYVQAVDRNLMHTDFYDFVIPEFDTIGQQEMKPEELYFDRGLNMKQGLYNRRYYEAIDMLSSVHGPFKNSLLHWHDARYFKSAPSLSPEFIRINTENDDLDRVFSVYNHEQIYHFFAFSGVVVRPMSKFMQYGAL